MLALSPPPLFSTIGWGLEDIVSHNKQKHKHGEWREDSFLLHDHHLPSNGDQLQLGKGLGDQAGICSSASGGDAMMLKKLSHNASERSRRSRINSLYSSLRSLLPLSHHHKKKLSIPSTVSQVVKYIPELQKEVERLVQKKEELLSRISGQAAETSVEENKTRAASTRNTPSSTTAVSANQVGEREVVILISTANKTTTTPLSEVLQYLGKDLGLHLLNASSFHQPFGERLFYNLHLQVLGAEKMEYFEALSPKLLSFYEKMEWLLP